MILQKTQMVCFCKDCNRCSAVQIGRLRRYLLTSEASRRCQTLVTANGTTWRHISEGSNYDCIQQSRRLENLTFTLQVAKMHRSVDVKLLSAWKLRLVRCHADTSKLQGQWEPSPPPLSAAKCEQR
jgi:hypothetical protein